MSSTKKIWEKLNKELGGEALFRADEEIKFKLDVIDFPSIALGSALGIWGAPRGKILCYVGGENSGKSFLAILQVIEAQKEIGTEQVWLDTENSANTAWMKSLGVDLTRLHIMPINDGVEIMTALCGRFNKEGKKTVPGILDLVQTKELNVNLVVLDSIADIQPPQEASRSFDSLEIAPLPKFLNRSFRFLRPSLAKANVAMIAINHLREGMNGGPPSMPGGRGLKHNLDAVCHIHASTGADATLLNAKGEKVGHKIILTVQKCRFSVNKHAAEIWLDFTRGVIRLGEEVATIGHAFGIVERPNNLMWHYGSHVVKGKDNFFELLDTNIELRNEIIAKIKAKKAAGGVAKIEDSADILASAAMAATVDELMNDDIENSNNDA